MVAQSSTGINQQNGARLFRYSDWFPRYPSPKLKKLKIYETRCVDGPHGKNISNMIISWYRFVCKQLAPPKEIMSPLETSSQWHNRTSWRQLQWVRISRENCCSCEKHSVFLQRQIHLAPSPVLVTSLSTKNWKWLGQQAVDWGRPDWQYSGISCRSIRILRDQFRLILTMSLRSNLHYRKLWFLSDLLQRKNQVNQLN